MGAILESTTDFDMVRSFEGVGLGADSSEFPDISIASDGLLNAAELLITARVDAKAAVNGSPTVAQILAGTSPAVDADKGFLRAAVIYRVAYLFNVGGETNAVNTSETVGPQTEDLGGVGAQWQSQAERALEICDQMLTFITNWKVYRQLT